MKKMLGITGIRSDYDLMSGLYRRLAADPAVDFRLLVGGAHLSKTHGFSIDLIREDGIPILATIESLLDADSTSSRLKSASIMLQSATDIVAAWKPELILYAGDREEVWIGGLLGNYLEIPTVHFYGGDHTKSWHIDNPGQGMPPPNVSRSTWSRPTSIACGCSPWESQMRESGRWVSLALDNFFEPTP